MTNIPTLDRNAICRAAERHGVTELALFGSASTGEVTGDSDVDFLVDFLPGRPDPFDDFCGLKEDLSRIVARDVDVVVNRAVKNPYFKQSALAQAQTIYVADA